MILEVAVIVLFLFWAGTLAMFLAYIKAQRVIAAQQAQGDALRDQRISSDGVVVIKAQRFRTQDLNRDDAVARLAEMVTAVWAEPVERRATKPTRASRQRRLEGKKLRGQVKAMRGKIGD